MLPFLQVRLSTTPGVTVTDVAWNPGADLASMFCSVMSDGAVAMWEIGDKLGIVGSLPADVAQATCCESPLPFPV